MWVLPRSRVQEKGATGGFSGGKILDTNPHRYAWAVEVHMWPEWEQSRCPPSGSRIVQGLALSLPRPVAVHASAPPAPPVRPLPGWAPLTDAVVVHVAVPVVTLLPGLQDPIPTGAVVVYSVVHRVEGGHLAKETHGSDQGWHAGHRRQDGSLALGPEALGLWGLPPGGGGEALLLLRALQLTGKLDQIKTAAWQCGDGSPSGTLAQRGGSIWGAGARRTAQKQSKGGCLGLPREQIAESSAPGPTVGPSFL